MTPNEWVAVIVGLFAIISGFAGFVKWLVKHFLNELKPNGGGSMKDQVNVNTERLTRVESRVDDIYKILCERNSN
jgi:uncharacterized membrane protein